MANKFYLLRTPRNKEADQEVATCSVNGNNSDTQGPATLKEVSLLKVGMDRNWSDYEYVIVKIYPKGE